MKDEHFTNIARSQLDSTRSASNILPHYAGSSIVTGVLLAVPIPESWPHSVRYCLRRTAHMLGMSLRVPRMMSVPSGQIEKPTLSYGERTVGTYLHMCAQASWRYYSFL